MTTETGPVFGRLKRRDPIGDLAPLAAALLLSDRALISAPVPVWVELAVMAFASQVAVWRLRPEASAARKFAARLPWMALVAAAAWALFRLGLKLPLTSLAFVPVWLGLEAAYRLVWLGRGALRAAWRRHHRPAGAILLLGALAWGAARYDFGWGTRLAWMAAALAAFALAARGAARRGDPAAETARWAGVGAAAAFLLRGFLRPVLQGGGDARWYATLLADMIAQARAGIFPIWTGQSIDQFNGAIYPLRVAPAFQHLGVLLDLATGRSLGAVALQNLLIVLLGLATAYGAYFTLASLLPGRRGWAAVLAILFLACPGTIGVPYVADLFMSWTAAPCLPFVWYATVRSFHDGGRARTLVLLGATLGLCWWGHSPIAIWTTLIAAAAQLIRVATGPRGRLGALAAGALAFAAVAAYPVGSVLLYPPESQLKAYAFQAASPANIVLFLREAFPAVLQPLSFQARSLGDLQLGYAVWGLLLLGLARWLRLRAPEARLLLGAAAVLALLLTPVPRLDVAWWSAIPGWIRNPTGNWAMNRLYLVLSGLVTYGVAAALARGAFDAPGWRRALRALAAAGCVWSLGEAARFAQSPAAAPTAAANAAVLLRPENAVITRFAYLVFPHEPAYFTHGAADPALENRLRREPGGPVLVDDYAAARAGAAVRMRAAFAPAPSGTAWRLPAPLRLEPGRRYLLDFDFADPDGTRGTLRLEGRSLDRAYGLPDYGEPASFGAGGRHSPLLSLWTSRADGEEVSVEFDPSPPAPIAAGAAAPARVSFLEYDPARLPIRVESWMPYRARVEAAAAAWLETPRMYLDGYAGWVDGQRAALRKSSEGLVAVRVPAGRSEVEVRFEAPGGLRALYWLSLGAIGAIGAGLAAKTIRQALGPAAY